MTEKKIRLDTEENSKKFPWFTGDVRLAIRSDETDELVSAQFSHVPAGAANVPHCHLHEDELFYVIDGQVEVICGHDTHFLEKGDAIFAPRGIPHGLRNASLEDATVLVILTPGKIEEAFLKASDENEERQPIEVFSDYGITFFKGKLDPDFRFDEVPEPLPPVLAKKSESEKLFLAGDLYTLLLKSEQSNNEVTLFHMEIPPGGGPMPHIHHREFEFFLVLEGEVTLFGPEGKYSAGKGDIAVLPPEIPHHFTNDTNTTAEMLAITAPGGFGKFLEEAGTPAVDGQKPPAINEEEIQRVIAASKKYGIDILPPEK